MRILFVFDALSLKFKVETEMLKNDLFEFHSIINQKHLSKWIELYDPQLIIISLESNSIFELTQLVNQNNKEIDYYIVSEELNADSISNVKIISNQDLLNLIVNKFVSIKEDTQVKKEDVLIKINEKYKRIRFIDIIYVEAEGKYVNLVLEERTFNIRTSLKSFMLVLPEYFVRSHASYIINTKKIDAIHINEQNIEAGKYSIPYSRKYKTEILDKFHLG